MIFNPATGGGGGGSRKIAVYSMIMDADAAKSFDFGFTPISHLLMVDDLSPVSGKYGSSVRAGDIRVLGPVATGTDCMIKNRGDVSHNVCLVVFGENNG